MFENETFEQRIRRLRKSRGLTQGQVANVCLVSGVTVNRWEKGTRQPRAEELKRLATALHVTENELLNGTPSETSGWTLHVEVGETKEDFINMKGRIKPESVIITSSDGAFLKIGGSYELWADKAGFKKIIKELMRLQPAVLANGKALGGIKED